MLLQGRKILVGVTGSIAAYKAAVLVRLLVKSGAEVKVIMTDMAQAFITPLTLATLSKNPVFTAFSDTKTGIWNNHVELGLWADALLIAPASAHTLGKMAHGICDNLLLATYLSARCPVWVAPAMDLDMWQHPAVTQNIGRLHSFGHQIITPGTGELASGLRGPGRMAEPEEMVAMLETAFAENRPLRGKAVLITAGPTHEAIDPVRFIGNHSTGKMGFALADAFAAAGAQVRVVAGPTHLHPQGAGIETTRVTSAEEMFQAALHLHDQSDICVFAAAVADYKPARVAAQKIKKEEDAPALTLTHTVDIAKELGARKKAGQFHVGFALETEHERMNAEKKLRSKNFDVIVLNSLRDEGAGFGHDTNRVTLLDAHTNMVELALKSKAEVAHDIVQFVVQKLAQ